MPGAAIQTVLLLKMENTRIDSAAAATPEVRISALELPAPGFERFTFPRYRALLAGTEAPETMHERIAVGARLGDAPVGLAFYSRAFEDGAKRRLLSVMVSPLLRRHGYASRMLALGEALAVARGAQVLTATHSSQMPAVTAYEALIRSAAWSAPAEFEYRLAGKASWALQAAQDWAPFLARLETRGYGSTPWGEISQGDRERIAQMVESELPEADRQFEPFTPEKKVGLLPDLSLLLRRRGEIVGWILASQGAMPGSVYYSSGYVVHSVRRAGWLVGGVREVCQRQAERLGGDTLSVFETSPKNNEMRRFMDRQLKPYSVWTDIRYTSEKQIGATHGEATTAPVASA